jgi:hypothetical protein
MTELTNAMKGVIQSSTARTSSTYASTDLIQLYDSNNAPTIKISKDDLMAAVKASLPSLLSDQGTSGTAFPSIASGVLGSMTAANLASVLGAMLNLATTLKSGADMNEKTGNGYYAVATSISSSILNAPPSVGYALVEVICFGGSTQILQTWTNLNNNTNRIYQRFFNNGVWSNWVLIK